MMPFLSWFVVGVVIGVVLAVAVPRLSRWRRAWAYNHNPMARYAEQAVQDAGFKRDGMGRPT